MPDNQTPVMAIIAGRGNLPLLIIEECQKKQQKFVLLLLASENYQTDYSQYQPIYITYGEVEKLLAIFATHQVKQLVMAGAVNKPAFSQLKVDKTGSFLLAKILANKILGDDAVLKTVINFFSQHQIEVLKISQVLDCLANKLGVLTVNQPSAENMLDIELGKTAIKHFSNFDVGQAVAVAQKQIIAVEAVEGTDAMIARCQNLDIGYNKQAILVKMAKQKQSQKADLPTIGLDTIANLAKAGFVGLAIEFNKTIILQKHETIELANRLGLFVVVIR
ncbi:MAG: LpxI family protein [Proteobacteria bacterium]|nr:LpxI family protein [Pseudomonadota bacterium]